MRAYSSRVTPCSAAITGVTRISVLAVAMFKSARRIGNLSRCRLGRADERFDHGAENGQAVSGAECRFHSALGMRHESSDVALAVADSGDIVNCTVGIAGVVVGAVRSGVAEDHLAIFFEVRKRLFVAVVVAIRMRDGKLEDLSLLRGVGEQRVRLLDADVHVAADEAEAAIAHHRAGKQAGFAKSLEAVTDAQDHAAAFGEFLDGLHHRRKTRNRASPQIVAVRKSAGQNDSVAIREIFGLVPDEFDGFVKDVANGVKRVVVAIGPGENDDSKFHAVPAPCGIAGTLILAQERASHATTLAAY